jgi:diacylglycerol kinase (ATP)
VWHRLRARLDELGAWSCVWTERPGHAIELARSAAAAGARRVVAVGGDGTVSEVANGLAATGVSLAVIPAGAGNDFSRSIGIPTNPLAAARLAFQPASRSIDLGEIDVGGQRRYFVNVASFGFDAEVTRAARMLPRWLPGGLLYVLAVLTTVRHYRPAPVELILDERVVRGKTLLVAVANGRWYGGGMRIAPDAHLDDGLLDVCIGGELRVREVLGLVPRIYTGGHIGHPKVQFLRCHQLSATSPSVVQCQTDGEPVGCLPATFLIHPGGLNCVLGPTAPALTRQAFR